MNQDPKDRNEKPHLLHAKVGVWSAYHGIDWSVECPYEDDDIRDCGAVEECSGVPADVERWGCRPYPEEPKFPEGQKPDEDLPEDFRLAFLAWEDAVEEWKSDHIYYGEGRYGHRSKECWFVQIVGLGDLEPDDFLHNIPNGTPVVSPLPVRVDYEGHYEETSPNFTPWKDTHDDAR
jgi:hypothetical protein